MVSSKDVLQVLILDDHQQDARLMVEQLERAGFHPDWAHVGTIQDFQRELQLPPDLILVGDLSPAHQVLDALRVLEDSITDVPLLILSNHIPEEIIGRAIKQGADGYLLKDHLERLGAAVEAAFAERQKQALRDSASQVNYGSLINHQGGRREMEVIVSVNAALRNLPNREMMLPVIADIILGIAPANGILISVKDAVSGELQVANISGDWAEITGLSFYLEDSAAEAIYQGGEPAIWDHPAEVDGLEISPRGIELGSLVSLPLTSSQENIGFIWFGCESECPEEAVHLAQVVANIAATAIHRSSLNENTLRALQESEALANISRILYQNLDLNRIFRQIVEEAIGIIGEAYRAVIHLYDERNQRLHAVALGEMVEGKITPKSLIQIRVSPNKEFDFGVLSDEDIHAASMSSGKGIAGTVIETGAPMIVRDTAQDQRYLQTDLETETRSMVVAPILSGERRLGTLSVLGSDPNLFTITDQNLLEKLCLQVSIAIENARLLEAERQQRELAQTQAEISSLLNQSLSMNEVLAGIINYTLRFFGAKAANIMLVESDQLRVARHIGYESDEGKVEFQPLKIEALPPDDLLRKAYESGSKITLLDVKDDQNCRGKIAFDWLRSFVIIPLKVGNRVIGLLNVDSEEPNAFGKPELEQLDIFANSASAAVNNAQLYQVLEQTLETEKSTRLQLIRADKLAGMGRMVASVAHELNNPLQTIKNCLFLIEQSFAEEDVDLLDLALSEVERLSSIVNRLRDVYRPVDFNEFQQIELQPMLAELEMLLETHLRRHSVQLTLNRQGTQNLLIRAIPDQLKQVFLNLSLNGIEAMQPDGGELEISVTVDRNAQRAGVLFSDTGPGIPEDDLKLIFDPFYTTKSAGMGLGLSICYDIVQNHNGLIEVKNNPESGVTFTVWLPVQIGE